MQQPYRQRQLQPNATNTATSTTTSDSESSSSGFPPVLRLRGASQSHVTTTDNHDAPESIEQRSTGDGSAARRVRWDENVVNNEGMGKKSSKVCCIYHRPRAIGESSSESDSSSSDDSDTDDDADVRSKCRRDQAVPCDHPDHVHGSNQEHGTRRTRPRKPSPNAYERQPRNERKHTKQQSKADS